MDIKLNLHITVDPAITTLITSLLGGTATKIVQPAKAVTEAATNDSTVTVEELREVASVLMIKNKAALKEILTKYNAKTVAALEEADYAGALAAMKKSTK